MARKDIIIIADYSQESLLRFDEICTICNVSSDTIVSLIEYEIIHPRGNTPAEWTFDLAELKRIKTALRLQHDLEVNLQGVAVVLQLLDEMDDLRIKLELLEKHFSSL